MTDMKPTIVPKSDQLNADDLLSGPITIKITEVKIKPGEQPVSIHYEDDNGKPYKPCKSMCRVMVSAWGADAAKYIGHRMTLYCDPKVKWAGMEVGGIRISHMSDIDESMTMALTVTRANKKPFTVKPLVSGAPEAAAAQAIRASSTSSGDAPATAAAPDDAAIVKDIEGWVKRKKFDMAYDLARSLPDATRAETVARIDNAKAYVEGRK